MSPGGGQYGRLLSEAASRLAIPLVALDPSLLAPAKQISAVSLLHPTLSHVEGSYTNADDIKKIVERVNILTIEIEHVNVQALFEIRDAYRTTGGYLGKGVTIFPSPETIAIVQDKLSQKQFLRNLDILVTDFVKLSEPTVNGVAQAAETLGWPLLLKARRQAYDGRGNSLIHATADAQRALDTLHGQLYAERYVANIVREIVVILVRGADGDIRSYGAVENVHVGRIGHLVRAPLRHSDSDVSVRAQSQAEKAIRSLPDGAVGVFGVEFFLLSDGTFEIMVASYLQ